jgi:hypothetical protein
VELIDAEAELEQQVERVVDELVAPLGERAGLQVG